MSDRKIKITFSEKCTSGFINCFSCLVYKRRTYVTRPKPWHPPSPPPPKKHKHTHTRTNAHAHAHAHTHTHTHTPKIWFIVHASRVEVYAFTLGFKIVYSLGGRSCVMSRYREQMLFCFRTITSTDSGRVIFKYRSIWAAGTCIHWKSRILIQ